MKNSAIDQDAYTYMLQIIMKERILDLYVEGSWLVAELEHCRFMVKNKRYDR